MKRRFVDDEMLKEMRRLAEEGMSRKEIAEKMDIDPSTVTRCLGSVRPYNFRRGALVSD